MHTSNFHLIRYVDLHLMWHLTITNKLTPHDIFSLSLFKCAGKRCFVAQPFTIVIYNTYGSKVSIIYDVTLENISNVCYLLIIIKWMPIFHLCITNKTKYSYNAFPRNSRFDETAVEFFAWPLRDKFPHRKLHIFSNGK